MIFLWIYAIGAVLGLASIPMINSFCETAYGVPMGKMYLRPSVPSSSLLIMLDPVPVAFGSLVWPIAAACAIVYALGYYPVKGLNALLKYPGIALGRKLKRTIEVKQIHDRYLREAEAEVERLLKG